MTCTRAASPTEPPASLSGDEYRTGDHIHLLPKVKPSYADTITIDPAIAADVDLNEVLFNEHGFAERTEAVLMVTNPNVDGSYRLRVSFYAQVGQKIPSLLLYDWECPGWVSGGPGVLPLCPYC
jgi:hypothetical protein